MANTTPYQVLAGSPIAIYRAVVGTAFPTLDVLAAAFNVAWVLLGTSGDLSYDEGGGIKVEHPHSVNVFRPLGALGPIKIFRQQEDCLVKVKVIDLTLEAYANALNSNTVTTVAAGAGTAGYRWIGLSRGPVVAQSALLIRLLASPYGASYIGQYEIPKASEIGSPTVEYMKATPAGLELTFQALVDPSAATADRYFGRLLFQHAAAA